MLEWPPGQQQGRSWQRQVPGAAGALQQPQPEAPQGLALGGWLPALALLWAQPRMLLALLPAWAVQVEHMGRARLLGGLQEHAGLGVWGAVRGLAEGLREAGRAAAWDARDRPALALRAASEGGPLSTGDSMRAAAEGGRGFMMGANPALHHEVVRQPHEWGSTSGQACGHSSSGRSWCWCCGAHLTAADCAGMARGAASGCAWK